MPDCFAFFGTEFGTCGIVWAERGVKGVLLPEESSTAARARLAARWPGAQESEPGAAVREAIAAIRALLKGGEGGEAVLSFQPLCSVRLDMEGIPAFHRRVYEAARAIPPGETVSYGTLAARLGAPGAARAVGQALARNPFALIVPCHRVLSASGKLGGFSAYGGIATKRRLLTLEGAWRSQAVEKPIREERVSRCYNN